MPSLNDYRAIHDLLVEPLAQGIEERGFEMGKGTGLASQDAIECDNDDRVISSTRGHTEHKIILDWCNQKITGLQKQLNLFEAGTLAMRKHDGTGWIDISNETIDDLKGSVAELARPIAQYGSEKQTA